MDDSTDNGDKDDSDDDDDLDEGGNYQNMLFNMWALVKGEKLVFFFRSFL